MKDALDHCLTIWWWNMGHKTKDFEGTYKEWFAKQSIKKISIKETEKTLVFKGSFGSMNFKIELGKDYVHSFNLIIKFCLTFLGDKALLRDAYNREYKINWR